MKKRLLAVAAPLVLLAGCRSGPSHLSNSVWDMQNKAYEDSPFVTALITDVIPFYPLIGALGGIVDWVVLNPVQFWGSDVWGGHGSSFVHDNPKGDKAPWFKK